MTDGLGRVARIVVLAVLGLVLLACIAAVLFPVFAKDRAKARIGSDRALTAPSATVKQLGKGSAVPPGAPAALPEAALTDEAGSPPRNAAAMVAGGPSIPFGAAVSAAIDRKLVREADVALVDLEDAGRAMAQIEAIATSVGGFVFASDYSSRPDGAHDGSITIRVPGEAFEQAVAGIRKVGKIGRINVNVEDVTDQYVDLDARIRNEEREEQELIKLYNRQGTLNDIFTVEQKLAEVRGRIEQLKGSLRVLENQVSLSTIRVTLTEKGVPLPPLEEEVEPYSARWHVQRAWRALVSVGRSLLTTVIYLVIVGWVVWVPLLLLVRLALRQQRQQRERLAGWEPSAPPGTEQESPPAE